MTTTTAKTLLAQADQLMRRPRPPEDLPVLTDLVRASTSPQRQPLPSAGARRESAPPELDERVDEPTSHAGAIPLPEVEELSVQAFRDARSGFSNNPVRPPASAPTRTTPAAESAPSRASSDAPLGVTREQLNAMLSKRLEQMQHSVYSQVMQQLELHANGRMKENLVSVLVPALSTLANDIATRVAEDTANQMQNVIADAVEKEVARLRDQLSQKRDNR
ncbi:MAG: hypothetical protein EAZ30_11910 [Betaproteobacteria bacterium]|nr:MAG: hypothetical protein EAZ43_07200 [Betaproteobacteria bacterium]TAG46741.1 MAG: hypothetical protein EAZ30_11910 [Betaproteobacteria bacterium]